jgi:LacI family transcriptional regulator
MTTITDVARVAGVSLSTVSHVLNGTRFVSPETEKIVRDAIAQTGYTPNTLARALARSTTNSVGIAISAVSNPYFSDIIRAVESECAGLGMTVFLSDTHDHPQKELEVVQALHQRRVDGIILAPCSSSEQSALTYLEDNKIPTVLVDRLASAKFDQIGVHNTKSVRDLVDHLVEHGHRRIGMVPGQPGFATTLERIEGFRTGLQQHRLAWEPSLLTPGTIDVEGAARSIVRMMRGATPPTAVIGGNNLATIGVMRGFRRLGLKVPQDVALVGFDDFEWADSFEPHLTLIAQPCLEIGRRAAKLLLERIKNQDRAPSTVRLKTRLIIRSSCGCTFNRQI